jgi:hypothetical protein
LAISNVAGKVRVEDLKSKNGSVLLRANAAPAPLTPGVLQVLIPQDRIGLAEGALEIRLSGKQRAHGRYQPDLNSPPPWAAGPQVTRRI